MTLLILLGMGLCGIVLCAGACFVGDPDCILGQFLDRATRMAKFMVPVLLLLLCLHATCDVGALSKTILDTVVENTGGLSFNYGFFSSSG